ncbi:DUF2269 family protein [Fodinibius halophilus]|uniref:DUF2269 family protein n=1 Tax=Fodinibius halophilus TaxID=1736908 RepID=A0A6M1T8T7_9BACT|nr:DUF2269 family protein [Fodinibius halophilus]NGP86792.1 DUF2269 family protein [Fodinibius halophilus]
MSYQFYFWLHIISYVIWLVAFAGSLICGIKIRIEDSTPVQKRLIRYERLLSAIGSYTGAIGIIISGSIMSSMSVGPPWGWFDVQLYPWLALKQLLFGIIILFLAIEIKRNIILKKYLSQQKEILYSKIKKRWRNAYRISMIIYALVVLSIFLGILKPALS